MIVEFKSSDHKLITFIARTGYNSQVLDNKNNILVCDLILSVVVNISRNLQTKLFKCTAKL